MDVSIIDSLKNEGYVYKIFEKEKDKYYTGADDFIYFAMSLKDNVKKQNANKIIFEKKKSNELRDYPEFPFIEDKKTYIIKYYNVSSIQIFYMELNFYKDKLFEIKVDENRELNIALQTKYKSTEEKELGKIAINCGGNYQDMSIKYVFRNDDVHAYIAKNTFYYNCESHQVTYFVINDKCTAEYVFSIEHSAFVKKVNDPNRHELNSLKKL